VKLAGSSSIGRNNAQRRGDNTGGPDDPELSIRGRPQMFREIHTFAGPFLGPRNAQENIFFA